MTASADGPMTAARGRRRGVLKGALGVNWPRGSFELIVGRGVLSKCSVALAWASGA